jgi:excisionase family DNA binding protein
MKGRQPLQPSSPPAVMPLGEIRLESLKSVAARIGNCSTRHIYHLIAAGELGAVVKTGKKSCLPVHEVDAYIRRQIDCRGK